MTRVPQLALLLVLPLALAVPPARAAAAPLPTGATELLVAAERALAAAAGAVEATPGWIGTQHSGHAPVARGLDDMRGSLGAVRAAVASRGAGLPRALRRGSVALAGLRVAWSRSGLAAPAAGRRLRELAVAFDALRARCGPEGARAARGGALTPAEREQLARVQEAREAFAAALEPLGARATARGDRWLAGELQRWSAQSARIAAAPPAVETLLEAVWLADHLQGEWTAAAPHVPPPDRGDWLAAHTAVEEVLGESEVGYLVVADLGGAAEPLSVEPAAPAAGEEATGIELQVLAPEPVVLFQPPEPEEVWGEEEAEEEEESAEVVEEPETPAEPAAEEEGADDVAPGEPAAEEPAESPATTIEVVTESGEVLTVELGQAGAPPAEDAVPAPPPAAAAPPPSP